MAHSHEEKCPKCGAVIYVQVMPMGVPGGKEKEETYCPYCKTLLYEAMIDGWFETSVIIPPIVPSYKKNEN